jgi:predicted outer membrane repeat protein
MKRIRGCFKPGPAVTFMLLMLIPLGLHAAVIHVPADQPSITAGMIAADDGDTVLVADGTYTGPTNKNLNFWGKAILVRSENGAASCIIDCENDGRGFAFDSEEGNTSVVQGFTIQNGYAPENYGSVGGAIYVGYHCSPRITGCIIKDNIAYADASSFVGSVGGGIYCYLSSPTITDNTFTDNEAWYGGAISCYHASPTISHNTFSGNTATHAGGAVFYEECYTTSTISNNMISGNQAIVGGGIGCVFYNQVVMSGNIIEGNSADLGGGIYCQWFDNSTIVNNTIVGNQADEGGAIYCGNASITDIVNNLILDNEAGSGAGVCLSETMDFVTFVNNTMVNNSADAGGAIHCSKAYLNALNNILWGNSASTGKEIFIGFGGTSDPSWVVIDYSDLEGGQASVYTEPGCTLDWGAAMIDEDPLFAAQGDDAFYLSQIAAGQSVDSPCVDAGDPTDMTRTYVWGTTRSDLVLDIDVDDLGFHYPGLHRLVAGPGPGFDNPPMVRVFMPQQDAGYDHEFYAYGASHYGVNVTCGDVTGNGFDEIITGAGPGAIYGPHVRGFFGDGEPVPGLSFLAYGTAHYGVNVACGDVDGDTYDEIITGAGPSPAFGPHVRVWNYDNSGEVTPYDGASYFAYGAPSWGVNVSAGDIDGDGFDEIVTGAGPGAIYGPHVRGWNLDGGPPMAMPDISFLAYGTLKYGVNVACGDLDGDGIAEIVTAPGPSPFFSSHIRGWKTDGGQVTPMTGVNFIAWPGAKFGAKVYAGADLDDDGRDELVVGGGPDPDGGSEVIVFNYDDGTTTPWFTLEAYPGLSMGATVAGGLFAD